VIVAQSTKTRCVQKLDVIEATKGHDRQRHGRIVGSVALWDVVPEVELHTATIPAALRFYLLLWLGNSATIVPSCGLVLIGLGCRAGESN
jgi:hypothetical protein